MGTVCFCFFFNFHFLFLQAPSVIHMVLLFFFVFFPSYLRPSYRHPIIDLRVALSFFFLLGFFLFLGVVPIFVFCAPPFFPLSLRTISFTSHIRIVISPVVGIGAPATTVPQQPAGPCYKRVISGRKICNGMRDCRGTVATKRIQ